MHIHPEVATQVDTHTHTHTHTTHTHTHTPDPYSPLLIPGREPDLFVYCSLLLPSLLLAEKDRAGGAFLSLGFLLVLLSRNIPDSHV